MREFAPDFFQPLAGSALVAAAQVEHLDAVDGRGLFEYLLPAVGQYDGAQHVVAADKAVPRRFEPREVQLAAVELDVVVAAHVPEFEGVALPDPVGLLEVGQRERLVPLLRARLYLLKRRGAARVVLAEERDDLRLVRGQSRAQAVGEQVLRAVEDEVALVHREADALRG